MTTNECPSTFEELVINVDDIKLRCWDVGVQLIWSIKLDNLTYKDISYAISSFEFSIFTI